MTQQLTSREVALADELDQALARAETAEQDRDHLRTQVDAWNAFLREWNAESLAWRKERDPHTTPPTEATPQLFRTLMADVHEDALGYRALVEALCATMPDPDSWDGDEAEIAIMLRYIEHISEVLQGIDAAGGLGSSRRAQDEQPAVAYAGDPRRRGVAFNALSRALSAVDRFVSLSERETVTAAVLNALDADRPQSGYFPPSQGQEIPADQLDALVNDEGLTYGDTARSAYRIGFAAALGYEITVGDGRVGVGDRPEPAHIAPETAQDAARRLGQELERTRAELAQASGRVAEQQTMLAATRALLDEARAERDRALEHLDRLDACTRLGLTLTVVGHPQWSGHITILGFATPQTAMRIGRVFTDALTRYVGARVQATLIDPRDAAADPLRPAEVAP